MALADAQAFPAKGTAIRIPISMWEKDGDPITASWTGVAVKISDSSTGTTIADITGEVTLSQFTGTNAGVLDIPASRTNAPFFVVQVTVGNSDAIPSHYAVYTVDMSDEGTRPTNQLDRMIAWLFRRWFNKRSEDGANLNVYADDDTTVMATGSISTSATSTTGGKMS